jgi:hypothetical protein
MISQFPPEVVVADAANATALLSAVASAMVCSGGLDPCTVNDKLDGAAVICAATAAGTIVIEKSRVVVSLQAIARRPNVNVPGVLGVPAMPFGAPPRSG